MQNFNHFPQSHFFLLSVHCFPNNAKSKVSAPNPRIPYFKNKFRIKYRELPSLLTISEHANSLTRFLRSCHTHTHAHTHTYTHTHIHTYIHGHKQHMTHYYILQVMGKEVRRADHSQLL